MLGHMISGLVNRFRRTGAERYLDSRLEDEEYAEAYDAERQNLMLLQFRTEPVRRDWHQIEIWVEMPEEDFDEYFEDVAEYSMEIGAILGVDAHVSATNNKIPWWLEGEDDD